MPPIGAAAAASSRLVLLVACRRSDRPCAMTSPGFTPPASTIIDSLRLISCTSRGSNLPFFCCTKTVGLAVLLEDGLRRNVQRVGNLFDDDLDVGQQARAAAAPAPANPAPEAAAAWHSSALLRYTARRCVRAATSPADRIRRRAPPPAADSAAAAEAARSTGPPGRALPVAAATLSPPRRRRHAELRRSSCICFMQLVAFVAGGRLHLLPQVASSSAVFVGQVARSRRGRPGLRAALPRPAPPA